ncbi:hypothetical protein V5O48_010067 [Marasmius crinis-equi]|uniref:F-box domain-containing protein n=1 Tax=Marasmius crinis-equi TaxID=585013 RepID=A0ABR3F9R3_9AGAR
MDSYTPVSTVSRLPPEILSEIFSFCPREDSTFDPSATIWSLGRVCSLWRQISIATPRLWVSVSLRLDVLENRTEEGSIAMLRCVLDRTAGLPLHVHIVTPTWGIRGYFQTLVDITRAESHRWISLKYDDNCMDSSSRAPVLYPDEKSLDQVPLSLRELELSFLYNRNPHDGDIRLYQSIAASPLLTKLVLNGIGEAQRYLSSLPWSRLRHLEILDENHTFSASWLRDVLSKCRSLETFVTYPCPWAGTPSPLRHETLRTLEFRPNEVFGKYGSKSDSVLGLSWLTLPALEHLVLADIDLESEMDSLIRMAEQSHCRLRSLSIRGMLLTEVTISRFLRVVGGSLVKLSLQGQLFGHLLDCIAFDEDFLPELEELDVRLDKRTVISPPIATVIGAIRARTLHAASSALKRVDIELYVYGHGEEVLSSVGENSGPHNWRGIQGSEPSQAALEALATDKLHVKVKRVQHEYYRETEGSQIRRFGRLLNSAVFRYRSPATLVNLHENMPVLDAIFTIIEKRSQEVCVEGQQTEQTLRRLAPLRYVLEQFVKKASQMPPDYNLPLRAEKLLDQKFGWNFPNAGRGSLKSNGAGGLRDGGWQKP